MTRKIWQTHRHKRLGRRGFCSGIEEAVSIPPVVLPVKQECTPSLFLLFSLGTLVTGEPVISGRGSVIESH